MIDNNLDRGNVLQQIYLDRINNYITTATFAEHYGIAYVSEAEILTGICRKVHESIVSAKGEKNDVDASEEITT
jgi:hypothetical protein